MKCTIVIDKDREEEVLVYAHAPSELTRELEALVQNHQTELIGYGDGSATRLQPSETFCFTVEGGKVYAMTKDERWQIKERLYLLEERLSKDFIRINQSCIVNAKQIARFEASLGGALLVILKNGYKDYVSRRQLKTVKERLGLQ